MKLLISSGKGSQNSQETRNSGDKIPGKYQKLYLSRTIIYEGGYNKKAAWLLKFEFSDGSIIAVINIEDYIEHNGKCYPPLKSPNHLILELFAAYF